MTLSPDERYVFYSQPGRVQGDFDGPSQFTVFDVVRQRIKMIVSTVGIKDGLQPVSMPINQLAVTPDTKWLVAAEGWAGASFLRFDIEKLEISGYYQMEGGFVNPAVQNHQ